IDDESNCTCWMFFLLQSKVAAFFGYTRFHLPPLSCSSEKQPDGTLPPMSVGPIIPWAVNACWSLAVARKFARVRPFTPWDLTILFTVSWKNRAAIHAWAPKPSAFDKPTELTNAFTGGDLLASSNGTKNVSRYWPSPAEPAVWLERGREQAREQSHTVH